MTRSYPAILTPCVNLQSNMVEWNIVNLVYYIEMLFCRCGQPRKSICRISNSFKNRLYKYGISEKNTFKIKRELARR